MACGCGGGRACFEFLRSSLSCAFAGRSGDGAAVACLCVGWSGYVWRLSVVTSGAGVRVLVPRGPGCGAAACQMVGAAAFVPARGLYLCVVLGWVPLLGLLTLCLCSWVCVVAVMPGMVLRVFSAVILVLRSLGHLWWRPLLFLFRCVSACRRRERRARRWQRAGAGRRSAGWGASLPPGGGGEGGGRKREGKKTTRKLCCELGPVEYRALQGAHKVGVLPAGFPPTPPRVT